MSVFNGGKFNSMLVIVICAVASNAAETKPHLPATMFALFSSTAGAPSLLGRNTGHLMEHAYLRGNVQKANIVTDQLQHKRRSVTFVSVSQAPLEYKNLIVMKDDTITFVGAGSRGRLQVWNATLFGTIRLERTNLTIHGVFELCGSLVLTHGSSVFIYGNFTTNTERCGPMPQKDEDRPHIRVAAPIQPSTVHNHGVFRVKGQATQQQISKYNVLVMTGISFVNEGHVSVERGNLDVANSTILQRHSRALFFMYNAQVTCKYNMEAPCIDILLGNFSAVGKVFIDDQKNIALRNGGTVRLEPELSGQDGSTVLSLLGALQQKPTGVLDLIINVTSIKIKLVAQISILGTVRVRWPAPEVQLFADGMCNIQSQQATYATQYSGENKPTDYMCCEYPLIYFPEDRPPPNFTFLLEHFPALDSRPDLPWNRFRVYTRQDTIEKGGDALVLYMPSCGAGSFQENAYQCRDCPAGKYSPKSGAIACNACDIGTYQDQTAGTHCWACQKGWMSSSTGSSSCTECGAGTSVNKQGSACEACNAGKYQYLGAQTACIRCAAGAFTPSHLTTGYTACKACEKGQWQPLPGQSSCLACEKGNYSQQEGASSCLSCPPASFSKTPASSACTLCAQGFSTWAHWLPSNTSLNTSSTKNTGATTCEACAPGTFASQGAWTCLDCPTNSVAPQKASAQCALCPPGTHQPFMAQRYCVKCLDSNETGGGGGSGRGVDSAATLPYEQDDYCTGARHELMQASHQVNINITQVMNVSGAGSGEPKLSVKPPSASPFQDWMYAVLAVGVVAAAACVVCCVRWRCRRAKPARPADCKKLMTHVMAHSHCHETQTQDIAYAKTGEQAQPASTTLSIVLESHLTFEQEESKELVLSSHPPSTEPEEHIYTIERRQQVTRTHPPPPPPPQPPPAAPPRPLPPPPPPPPVAATTHTLNMSTSSVAKSPAACPIPQPPPPPPSLIQPTRVQKPTDSAHKKAHTSSDKATSEPYYTLPSPPPPPPPPRPPAATIASTEDAKRFKYLMRGGVPRYAVTDREAVGSAAATSEFASASSTPPVSRTGRFFGNS